MRVIGIILLIIGLWMMISPQAILGLNVLKWMANYAFPGEAFFGAIVCAASLKFFRSLEERDNGTETLTH